MCYAAHAPSRVPFVNSLWVGVKASLHYVASFSVVAAPAPVVEYTSPEPAVSDATPAPVIATPARVLDPPLSVTGDEGHGRLEAWILLSFFFHKKKRRKRRRHSSGDGVPHLAPPALA